MIDPDLRARVESWRDDDPDPATVTEIDRLLAADDEVALRDRFDAELTFGTAGLRGPLGAGPNRMNRVVVRRTAAAIGRWLDARGQRGPVVIGLDARHGSHDFARDSAAVLAAAGRRVVLAPTPIPTPLLAFAVRDLDAAAGIMVTASHNPPADNGYKVYDSSGAQIVSPADAEIAAVLTDLGPTREIELASEDHAAIEPLPPAVRDRYLAGVAALRSDADAAGLRIAYTPMHGVGAELLAAAFARSDLPEPVMVGKQAAPDPDFPTVAFPNPEEPGAMDLVLGLADRIEADLVLANDPDADRLAVAVPVAGPARWRPLTGDEVGVLLADHLLGQGHGDDRLVATTVVSSTMLEQVAHAHGVRYVETLTGFKWLARAAETHPGSRLVLAYEEALGYAVGELVHDKDGISAAVAFVDLVATLRRDGTTVVDRLDQLARAHGVHLTAQHSIRYEGAGGPVAMAAVVAALRAETPDIVGGVTVTDHEDLALGIRLPATDAVVLRGDGLRIVARPSGTEPKLKVYVEVVGRPGDDVDRERELAGRRLDAVLADLPRILAG